MEENRRRNFQKHHLTIQQTLAQCEKNIYNTIAKAQTQVTSAKSSIFFADDTIFSITEDAEFYTQYAIEELCRRQELQQGKTLNEFEHNINNFVIIHLKLFLQQDNEKKTKNINTFDYLSYSYDVKFQAFVNFLRHEGIKYAHNITLFKQAQQDWHNINLQTNKNPKVFYLHNHSKLKISKKMLKT